MGEHKIGNIVPVCKDCNSRKAGTDYKEFLKNNTVALKKIEAYMHSKNYDPLGNSENNEQLKKILNMAHQEVAGVAKRYIEIVNDLFINGREEESY